MKNLFLIMSRISLLTSLGRKRELYVRNPDGSLTSIPAPPRPTSHLNPDCITVIEGCEYFKVNAYGSYTYVHKGNCKNPIHYQHMLEK